MHSNINAQITKTEVQSGDRKVRLTWEEVEGAVSYKIIMKDSKGNVIVSQDSASNSIVLELSPADYKLRIGSVNKFSKLSKWSDWADITIEKPKLVVKEEPGKKEKESGKERPPGGFKISLGISYFYILPDWNEYYNNSINGYSADIAYSFKNINFSGAMSFLKHAGFDFEGTYVKFDGKKELNKVESNITNIISGANIFFSTNSNFPLNFAVRGGAGISLTEQEYKKYDILGNPVASGTSKTSDLYYKAGLSAEYNFYSRFFIEAFADYYSINYLLKEFRSLRISCQAGVKF
jgi:hypothetical protein